MIAVAGCSGRAEFDANQSGAPMTPIAGASGASATSAGAAAGSSGGDSAPAGSGGIVGGAAAENLTPDGFPRCGELDLARANGCEGLDLLVPSNPNVSGNADGSINVGLIVPLFVELSNADTIAHADVCVGVSVNVTAISLYTDGQSDELQPIGGMVLAGETITVTPATMQVGKVSPGTVATFTFWSTYVGTNCHGPTATVDALVRPSLD
jgi:hypothetical protein